VGILALTINTTWGIPKVLAQPLETEIKIERILVKKVIVQGNTIFSPQEIHQVTNIFEGKEATAEKLLAIRTALTNLYVSKGYVTSGAFLPHQDLSNGIVTIKVIEGRLERIEIRGLTHLDENYVRDRLKRFAGIPLNIKDLGDGLKLLQINPIFSSISASLEVGSKTGQSVLVVTLTEAPPWSLSLLLDNSQPSDVGTTRGGVGIAEINLLGIGDRLDLSYNLSEGLNEFNAAYTIPLNALDGTLSIAYQNQQSRLIEKPFNNLGINAKYNEFSLSSRQPLIKTTEEELALGLSLSFKENTTFLFDDLPFSFTSSALNGETRLFLLTFSQEWQKRSSESVFALRSNFSFGVDLFKATSSGFFLWLGQLQWLKKLNENTILVTQLAAQLTPDKLVSSEQFSIGGVYTVRGYSRDFRIGDNGFLGSIEARFIILSDDKFGKIEITPFIDVGTVWNNEGEIPSPNTLLSLGAQLTWYVGDMTAKFSYGIPLFTGNGSNNNFNFRLQWIPVRF